MEKEGEVDRRSDGKTSSTMAAPDRTRCKGVLRSHLWCPLTTLQGNGIDLTRLDSVRIRSRIVYR